jgi:hypothetical protein
MAVQKVHPARQHIDHRLIVRLRLYCITCLVMLGVIVVEIVRHKMGITLAAGGIAIGLVLGIVVSRMYRLSWDEQTTKVVAQIDWIGGGILGLYITFIFFRDWFFGHWLQGSTLVEFGLCISAGLMLGRVLGARHGISIVLQSLGILEPTDETTER